MTDSDAPLPPLPQLEQPYRCPGQHGTVSEAVHLARLAAGDPRCGGCPSRPPEAAEFPAAAPTPANRPQAMCQADLAVGKLRGRYLVDLDRTRVTRWLLSWVTDRLLNGGAGVTLFVGQDRRHASADVAATIEHVRRCGVTIVDVGEVTRPLFRRAIRECDAAGGLLFTAGTHPAGWCGVDAFSSFGEPSSFPEPVERPALARTRRLPPIRRRDALTPYLILLARRLQDPRLHRVDPRTGHRNRPTRVAISCPRGLLTEIVRQLAGALPIELVSRAKRQPFDWAATFSADGCELRLTNAQGRAIESRTLRRWLPDAADHGDACLLLIEAIARLRSSSD